MPSRESFSALQRTFCGHSHQFSRHLKDAFLGLGLARLPACPPEAVQLTFRLFRAIAADQVDILNRQEDHVAASIFELEAIVRRACKFQRLQADIAPDSMINVHN